MNTKKLTRSGKVQVDYTNKQSVEAYYQSFDYWDFYVNGADVNGKNLHLVEITEDTLLFNGEYYLPAPTSNLENAFTKSNFTKGWYWVHIIKKEKHDFDNRVKGLLESIKKTYTFNIWFPYLSVNKNPTVKELQNLKPNNREIYCYPSGGAGNFRVAYTHSGREGLRIDDLSLINFKEWFRLTYLTQFGGHGKQIVFPSDDFLSYVEYGDEAFGENIGFEISKILNSSSYDIDDDDKYEYSLNHIKMSKECCNQVFALIDQRLKKWNGK